MRISLRDVDSKIPNLALMKISAYHKQKGDIIGFNVKNPDLVYSSIIFKKNNGKGKNQKRLSDAKFVYGGSGVDLNSKLPDEIEFIKPDYSLYDGIVCQSCGSTKGNCSCKHRKYGNIYFSMGFTTRGCNNNCYYCIVPPKEGKFKHWQHPKEFYDERFDTIKLLDNNILQDKKWFKKVANWCIDKGLKIDMTQGYDIRLVDEKIAAIILQINAGMCRFAFDDTKLEPIIRKKIAILKDAEFKLRDKVQFYCYCHDDAMHDDAVYRCNILKKLGTNAFLMYNCDIPRTTRIKNLIYWCNRKQLYWSISYNEYSKLLHT